MKSISIAVIAILLVFFVSISRHTKTSSSSEPTPATAEPKAAEAHNLPPAGQGGPVSWAPFKTSFVVTEGEAYLIAVDVDCPGRAATGNEFELLPPTPSFVHLSPVYLNTSLPRALGLISVGAQPGDAGKYEIKVKVSTCGGGGVGAAV